MLKSALACFASGLFISIFMTSAVAAPTATERVETAEKHILGKTFQADATMTVEKDGSTRTIKMNMKLSGRDKAIVKIFYPPKDKGTGNLRLNFNLWQFLPNVNRIIKIPPSMMLQSWMGSDFSNDDLVKGSSLARDYTHKIIAIEKVGNESAVKILCIPKKDAAVVWQKVEVWLREQDSVPLRHRYYTENGDMAKELTGYEIKTYGAHTIPTRLEMVANKKSGTSKTMVQYVAESVRFDEVISDEQFTQQNLRKPVDR